MFNRDVNIKSLIKKERFQDQSHTFSLSSLSIFGIDGASAFVKLDEYFGKVGGGIGRAAIAGFSCCLFELWMPAVGVPVTVEKLAM